MHSTFLDDLVHGIDVGHDTRFYDICGDRSTNHLMVLVTHFDRGLTHGCLFTRHRPYTVIFKLHGEARHLVHGLVRGIHRSIALGRGLFDLRHPGADEL